MTFQNGYDDTGYGGGAVFVDGGSALTFVLCVFQNNRVVLGRVSANVLKHYLESRASNPILFCSPLYLIHSIHPPMHTAR